MSGIHTHERFAILDARGGIHIDMFASLDDLTEAAIRWFIVRAEDPEAAAVTLRAHIGRALAYALDDEMEADRDG